MPAQASASASAADSARPLHRPLVMRCAAAGGPTISVNTKSTPTICAQADTASATMARNAVEMTRSGTPLASASSGCRLAKINGRMIAAKAASVTAPSAASVTIMVRSTASTLPNSSAVAWVAKAVW